LGELLKQRREALGLSKKAVAAAFNKDEDDAP
jgi:cytoskeletal protein RodZ